MSDVVLSRARLRITDTLARDLPASIVVFLVALPLCMGIAIASGVPPERGLVTGVVGGIVAGALAGAPLQVSGPAAGLTVLVFDLVREHGIGLLGPIVLLAGAIQLVAGLARTGQWFRAISPAVVHGMLAGIGVLIVAAQVHVLMDAKPLPGGLQNLLAIPGAFASLVPFDGDRREAALAVGLVTIAAMVGWERLRPHRLRLLPGALVGVIAATLLAAAFGLPVQHVEVPAALLDAVSVPGWADLARLTEPAVIQAAISIAFIASAETLLSAAAVDRMHTGPRTNYDNELMSQGVGNMICGALGALPMTGVIVRSSANVQAGAATRASTILHGVWLLAVVGLAPWLLREVPTAALAGVLVVTGWRLVSLQHVLHLLERHGWMPAAIWAATFATVIATDLLTGVLVGIGLGVLELLLQLARRPGGHADELGVELELDGLVTFMRVPHLLRTLEAAPAGGKVRLRTDRLAHVDHTALEALTDWARRAAMRGTKVEVDGAGREHQRLAAALGCSG